MTTAPVLNIFRERQPVTVLARAGSRKEPYLHGVAQMTEMPYLEVQLPKQSYPDFEGYEPNSPLRVFFEIDQSVLTLETHIVRVLDQTTFLLEVEDHRRKKQERSALRIEARNVDIRYRPLDEQASPLRGEKTDCVGVNISKAGILLRINEVVEPKQDLEIDIDLPESPTITCVGKVERLALQKAEQIEIAVRFEQIDESDQDMIGAWCGEQTHVLS